VYNTQYSIQGLIKAFYYFCTMEINPYGVAVAILLILIIASFVFMVLLMILQAIGLIRIRKTSHFILLSIVGGIVLAVVFWQVKEYTKKTTEPVNVTPVENKV
jgi:hypothetical protein